MPNVAQSSESLDAESEEQLEAVKIGRRLRALRTERSMTILEMAAKAGVSSGSISQIERGLPIHRSALCRSSARLWA